jgi:oligoendopeptidase F
MEKENSINKSNIKSINKTEIPDYSGVERAKIPGEHTWKVEDAYKDVKEWEKDKELLLGMMEKIEDYSQGWTDSANALYRMMNHVTRMQLIETKTYMYPRLLSDTDMEDSSYQAMKGEIHSISVEMNSKLAFLDPDLLELGPEKIAGYVKEEPRLKVYEMYFDSVIRMKKHILDTDKEEIMVQTGLFGETPGKAAGMLNDVDIPAPQITLSDGKKIRLNTSNYVRFRESNVREDRGKVMRSYWKNRSKYRHTHGTLLDGAVKKHYFDCKIRHYDSCLEAALYPDNIDTAVYHTLIETVKGNLSPLHRYLDLKAGMLGIEKLLYEDVYASSVPSVEKQYPIEEAGEIIIEALRPLGNEYTDVLAKGLKDRWMDIYPNKSKRSGAYSNGSIYDVHPYVLMNYNGSFNHLSTLAHEFGHALHSWFSNKNQPFPLADYPIFLAEIASTFNETLLVHYLLKIETDDLFKLFILDQYLDEFRGTLYRQTQFAEFELAIHREVEKGKTLTPDWLDKTYLKLARHYYGHKSKVMNVSRYIQNEWSSIPHFYYNFYVYQYSTGIASATALAENVLNGGETERQKYMTFLKSGCSKYPLDTLKDAGVDLRTPEPIEVALKTFDDVVTEMEKILARIQNKSGNVRQ